MKRIVIVLLLLAAVLGAAFFVLHRTRAEAQAAKLAPAETVFLVDLTDIPRTRERWKQAALHQLAQEPEVQAFLERPKSKFPELGEISEKKDRVSNLDPQEAFFALTSIKEEVPRFVAGLHFKGRKEDLDSLLDEARAWLHTAWPPGKPDLVKYGSIEIETFSYQNLVLAGAFDKEWYVVSDDADLLKKTLDRLDGKAGIPGEVLANETRFKASLEHMPKESDLLLYAQPETVAERVVSLVTASGGQLPTAQLEQLKHFQGAAATVKVDGQNIRDTLFILEAGAQKQEPMQRASLALTSTNTLFYYAGILQKLPSFTNLPAAGLPGSVSTLFNAVRAALDQQGLSRASFDAAFGPEFASRLDWPAASTQPALLFSLDLRDAGKAAKFLDAVFASPLGMAWARQTIDGTRFYVMNSTGIPTLAPALALTDKFLLLSPNFEEAKNAASSLKNPGPTLASTGDFKTAEGLVGAPTGSFGYLDGKAVCERVYGTLRPLAMMWAAFAPKVVEYVDPGKLPNTETLERHLGPIVYSESSVDGGVLLESAGPITFPELVNAAAIGAGVAALPKIKAQLQSAGFGAAPAATP